MPRPASPFEVVPGITSAIAAPAYAGIPVTHRGLSTHVTVVTGHEDPAKGTTDVDWDALARGGRHAGHPDGRGPRRRDRRPARSPAVARPTRRSRPCATAPAPTSRRCAPRSATIAEADVQRAVGDRRRRRRRPRPRRGSSADRSSAGGRRHPGTRAGERAARAARVARRRGPRAPGDRDRADRRSRCRTSTEYAWLVFTSANGVRGVLRSRARAGRASTPRALGGSRVAAIGPGTAAAFARTASRADLVPERFVAESLLEAFPPPAAPGDRVLLARAEQSPATCCPTGWPSAATRSTCSPCTARCRAEPDRESMLERGARRRRRRDHVHVVVDRHELLRRSSARCRTRSRRWCRSARSPRTTARDRGLRVDAEADRAHHRRPRRHALDASLTLTYGVERRMWSWPRTIDACRSPSTGCGGCAARPRCGASWPRRASVSTISSRRSS